MKHLHQPVIIKGVAYTSLDDIAAAIVAGDINLSDVPKVEAAIKHKSKPNKKELVTRQVKEFAPLKREDVKGRILRATLIANGTKVNYRFTPKWPYAIVPAEILDLPLEQQISTVRKAIDKMRPLWLEERRMKAAEFLATRTSVSLV